MIRSRQYIALHRACATFIVAAIAASVPGCGDPDPRTVRGALAAAAEALEARDARALFPIIDQRVRAAMASIVKDRREAARLITADYPEDDRAEALAGLGDTVGVDDPAELFARRCGEACLAELAAAVAAPVTETQLSDRDVEVETARGGRLRLHRGLDGWWGLHFHYEAVSAERTRAAREIIQIRQNAEVYRRRRALETSRP